MQVFSVLIILTVLVPGTLGDALGIKPSDTIKSRVVGGDSGSGKDVLMPKDRGIINGNGSMTSGSGSDLWPWNITHKQLGNDTQRMTGSGRGILSRSWRNMWAGNGMGSGRGDMNSALGNNIATVPRRSSPRMSVNCAENEVSAFLTKFIDRL